MTNLPVLRRIAAVALAAAAIAGVAGIPGLHFDSHYSAYFEDDDPRLVDHNEISGLYSRYDTLLIVLQSAHSFLDAGNYRLLADLTDELSVHPSVARALSISELGIVGETLTEEGDLIPSLEQLRTESRALGLLLAEDTKLAAVWLQIDLPDNAASTVLETLRGIRESVAALTSGSAVSAHYTGTLALNEAYTEVVREDLTRIFPLLLLVIVLALSWLLRSPRAVLTMLPVGMVAVIAAFGIAGIFGTTLAAINAFVPIIILSVSVAGCVHMALSYDHYRDAGAAPEEAAVSAARYNLLPMALANGTTALGFLGLALSPSPPIRVVGYLVATGIAVSFILCMTLLPVLQARFDPWKPATRSAQVYLSRIARFVTRRRVGIVALFLLLALPAGWLASRNVISDNVLTYFVPSHTFSRDTQLVEDRLSGVNEVLYSVQGPQERDLFRADAIEAIDRFAVWLREQPEVTRVICIADAHVLNEAMQAGRLQQRLDFYRDRADVSHAGSPLALEVSRDFSSSVISVFLEQLDSAALVRFDAAVHEWVARNMIGYEVTSGGAPLMFADLGERNTRGMLTALTAALLGAALLLGILLRSGRIAWVGLACNALPIVLVYSVWAVVNGQITIGAAVVMGMILGIVLDDTIYLLSTYRRARKRGVAEPIVYAYQRVGPALIVTTVTLIAGLSLGLLSSFGPIWNMSALSVAIIGVALIVTLSLLPALLPAGRTSRANA